MDQNRSLKVLADGISVADGCHIRLRGVSIGKKRPINVGKKGPINVGLKRPEDSRVKRANDNPQQ